MKKLIAILAFVIASQSNAQTYVSQPVQQLPQAAKPTVIYDERSNQLVEVAPQVEQVPQQQVAQPVYVINSQRVQGYQSAQIQEQPTTIVQEAPLKNSAADQMRKQRQETESGTEDGIVQALEKARMDDELKRRDRFNSALAPAAPTPAPIVQQAPPPVIVAAPVVQIEEEEPTPVRKKKVREVEEDETSNVDIKSEIRAALAEKEAQVPAAKQKNYISGLLGLGAYPDVVNVRGNGAAGVAVGLVTPERVVAEGSFLYGNYDLEDIFNYGYYPRIVAMKQYNFAAAVKYQILPGKITPNIGAGASYTRRSFSEYNRDFLTSDALDVAIIGGLDVALADALSVGIDMRYYWNVAYKNNSDRPSSFVYNRGRNPIEELQYYTATLSAKFTF